MIKPLLCRLGLHKPDKYRCAVATLHHGAGGRKKYRRNYQVCARCGKLIGTMKLDKVKH